MPQGEAEFEGLALEVAGLLDWDVQGAQEFHQAVLVLAVPAYPDDLECEGQEPVLVAGVMDGVVGVTFAGVVEAGLGREEAVLVRTDVLEAGSLQRLGEGLPELLVGRLDARSAVGLEANDVTEAGEGGEVLKVHAGRHARQGEGLPSTT